MDGYAVRADDVATAPVRLKVIGEVAAGRPFARRSARAKRHAFLPAACCRGADTVVMQEQADARGRQRRTPEALRAKAAMSVRRDWISRRARRCCHSRRIVCARATCAWPPA